jgi:hypothetical protein
MWGFVGNHMKINVCKLFPIIDTTAGSVLHPLICARIYSRPCRIAREFGGCGVARSVQAEFDIIERSYTRHQSRALYTQTLSFTAFLKVVALPFVNGVV